MMLKPLNKRIRVLLLTTFLLIITTPTLEEKKSRATTYLTGTE